MNCAIIVVSGEDQFGREYDPFALTGRISALQRIVLQIQSAGVDRIILVGSYASKKIEKHVARMPVTYLQNNNLDARTHENILMAFDSLSRTYEKIILTSVNFPFVSSSVIKKLLESEYSAVLPECNKKRGLPLALTNEKIQIAKNAQIPFDFHNIINGSFEWIETIEIEDQGAFFDISSTNEIEINQLASCQESNEPRVDLRICLCRESRFYGPGPQMLLELTKETGSLRAACSQMGISYSKGWKIIIKIEEELKAPILLRQKGGVGGGKSTLTEEGLILIENYRELCRRGNKAIEDLFREIFQKESGS